MVPFFHLDLTLEEVGGDGVAEGFETDREGFFGFAGEAEGELGLGEGLGEVGALGDGVEAVLKKREGLLVLAGVEVGAGEGPLVFAVRSFGRFAGVVGDFIDVSEVDELLEEGFAFLFVEGAAALL